MSKPQVSCLWGCGESVNPPKLNIQEVQGANLSSRPKGDLCNPQPIRIFYFCQIAHLEMLLETNFEDFSLQCTSLQSGISHLGKEENAILICSSAMAAMAEGMIESKVNLFHCLVCHWSILTNGHWRTICKRVEFIWWMPVILLMKDFQSILFRVCAK